MGLYFLCPSASRYALGQTGAKRGDLLHVKVELVKKPASHQELLNEYDAFVEKYGQTLKNLADR